MKLNREQFLNSYNKKFKSVINSMAKDLMSMENPLSVGVSGVRREVTYQLYLRLCSKFSELDPDNTETSRAFALKLQARIHALRKAEKAPEPAVVPCKKCESKFAAKSMRLIPINSSVEDLGAALSDLNPSQMGLLRAKLTEICQNKAEADQPVPESDEHLHAEANSEESKPE